MKVYACQLNSLWEDKTANFARVRSLVCRRGVSPKSLIVLPEMFATGFTMNTSASAEPDKGPTTAFMRQLASEHQSYVLGGFAHRVARKVFNEAICIAPSGKCLARYAKMHPFGPGNESDHYSAGQHLAIFRCGKLKAAVFICYDLRFPEAFRVAASLGAEVMIVIANWPRRRHSHWMTLLQARAIENQAYIVGVNRCGKDPKLDYAGGSVVFDPYGRKVVLAGSKESIIAANLDPMLPAQWRREFPVLKDIRRDFLKIGNNENDAVRRSKSAKYGTRFRKPFQFLFNNHAVSSTAARFTERSAAHK